MYESVCEVSRPGSKAYKAKRMARNFMIRSASASKVAPKTVKSSPSFVQNQGNVIALMLAKGTAVEYIPNRGSER